MRKLKCLGLLLICLAFAGGCSNPGPVPKDLKVNLPGFQQGLGGMSMGMGNSSGYPKMKLYSKGVNMGGSGFSGGSLAMVMVQKVDPEETMKNLWEQIKNNPNSLRAPTQIPQGIDYSQQQINISSGNRAILATANNPKSGAQMKHIVMLITTKGGYSAMAVGMTDSQQDKQTMVDAFRSATAVANPNSGGS